MLAIVVSAGSIFNSAVAEEAQQATVAFPDSWMIRLGTYIVDGTDTTFSVSSNVAGLGTVIGSRKHSFSNFLYSSPNTNCLLAKVNGECAMNTPLEIK